MHLEVALTDISFDLLLRLNAGGRPREIVLRLAVSSAYYAVFHALCRLCADELVGVTAPLDDRVAIYRSVDHASLKAIQKNPRLTSATQNIVKLATDLQVHRHQADYDPRPSNFGGRAAVLSLVRSAEDAVAAITELTPTDRKILAVALIARTRK